MSRRLNRTGSDVLALIDKIENELPSRQKTATDAGSSAGNLVDNEKRKAILEKTQKVRCAAMKVINSATQLEQETALLALAEAIALLDMTVRGCITESRNFRQPELEKGFAKRSLIVVDAPPGALLRVSIPPLIGKETRGIFNIYWKLKMALAQYEIEHPLPFPKDKKLVLIYKRYASSLANGHLCDNDNLEMKKTTNAIAEALHYSDNPEHFSMIYTTVKGPCDYVEATVIEQENLGNFLDYMRSETPSQPIPEFIK